MVAVAASAGGVEALTTFVGALPADFPAAVLVVLHIPPAGPSVLPRILERAGKLPARHPRDGEFLAGGVVLVAPPDHHLVVADHRAHVMTGPKENGHRPAGDVLLRSVAESFGQRSVGVVLSGTMDDGAAGLRAIRAVGGLTLVQDPEQAAFPNMPLAAIEEADPQIVGPVADLAAHICDWLAQLPDGQPGALVTDSGVYTADPDLTAMTCPECGGTLWLRDDYGAQRFRCRVGHTFSFDGLMMGKQTTLEHALWAAVVALEERADLSLRIAKRLRAGGRTAQLQLDRYQHEADSALERAAFLRGLIRELVQNASTTYEEADHSVDPTA